MLNEWVWHKLVNLKSFPEEEMIVSGSGSPVDRDRETVSLAPGRLEGRGRKSSSLVELGVGGGGIDSLPDPEVNSSRVTAEKPEASIMGLRPYLNLSLHLHWIKLCKARQRKLEVRIKNRGINKEKEYLSYHT